MVTNKESITELIQTKVRIRRAKEEDLQEVVRLAMELGRDESVRDSMISASPSGFQNPEWILKNIKGGNAAVFVAELDGRIVGYSLGWISQPWAYKGKRGYICDCFVEKSYRGKGIGRMLVNQILEWFISNGVECVEADVYSDNIRSLKLFKSLGFKEIFKRLRFMVKDRENRL
ncbi:MAG: GNAT family N-acetyltransferase [Candidatus Bathyarchaeia archaeon]